MTQAEELREAIDITASKSKAIELTHDGLEKNCDDADARAEELRAMEVTTQARLKSIMGQHKAVVEERRRALSRRPVE